MNTIGVLFDLDGVLIDSENLYTEFWSNIDKMYPTGVADFAFEIKGNTLTKILNTYFHDVELQEKIKELIHEFEYQIKYPIYEGVMEFLEALKSNTGVWEFARKIFCK